MKEFQLAVESVVREWTDEDWPHEFKIGARVLHFRNPEPGEAIVLITALAAGGSVLDRFATYLSLFTRVLRPDDREWWYASIMDTSNPLSRQAPQLLAGTEDGGGDGILAYVVQTWGADPTQEPSPSSDTPPPSGFGSTQSTPEWTSSVSPFGSS